METKNNSLEINELKVHLAAKTDIHIIDVRSKEEYNEKHIPTAINVPMDILKETAQLFDPVKKYVTVCGKGGGRSTDAAKFLNDLGFDSFWLIGGTFGWLEA